MRPDDSTAHRYGPCHRGSGGGRAIAWITIFAAALGGCGREQTGAAQSAAPAAHTADGSTRVLVAFHSESGNTRAMADAVADGIARVAGVAADVRAVADVTADDLTAADAVILGGPTHYGGMPGAMKSTIDRWIREWKVDLTDKIGGAFATGGGRTGGNAQVVDSILRYMLAGRMVIAGPFYERGDARWGEAGATAITGPTDAGISEAEKDGARRLGERIARLALRNETRP